MNVRRWLRTGVGMCVAMLIAVLGPTTAHAAMMYTLESGSLSISVDEYASSSGRLYRAADPVTVAIDSVQVMLDPGQDSVLSFDLGASPYVDLVLLPSTPARATNGYQTLVLESFRVQAASGTLLANDSGYAFDGAISVDAMFGGSGSSGVQGGMSGNPLMGDLGQGSVFGDLANGGPIRISGVAVGMFDSPFNGNQLVVTSNFSFVASAAAATPEPGSPLLFAAGLLVAGVAIRRRRRPGGTQAVAGGPA